MANKIYPEFILARLRGTNTDDLAAGGVNVKCVLVDLAQYTYSDAHDFLDDVAVGARIATSGNLANKTVARSGDDVNCDADDFDITIGASQPSIEALIYYIDTGSAATSRLIKFQDTGGGLPFTPNSAGETREIRVATGGFMQWGNP